MFYKCPICKKEYEDVAELSACVQECAKKVKQQTEELRKRKEKADILYTEIQKTFKHLEEMVEEYNSVRTDDLEYSVELTKSLRINCNDPLNYCISTSTQKPYENYYLWN